MLDDEEFDPDLQDRLNAAMQAGADASGIPWQPFTDEQKREAAAYAEAMAAVSAMNICGVLDEHGEYSPMKEYDTHDIRQPETRKLIPQGDMILQMLAADRYKRYLDACREDNERLLDTRRAPGYDEADPLTATRLYVLTDRPEYQVALETPYDWQGYLREALGYRYNCDVHLLHSCYDRQATPAMKTLVYKRGEHVFAWKICAACLDALSWIRYGDAKYSGPVNKWIDTGKRRPSPPPVDW
ncbi:hypothetical protein A5791_17280 [Mycobacterium sp. 852002-51163_SCH5372311]|uniref:hypothetical protein n=1 Tax=Mycobacterium sp. 852002-51163_SCH5372311 TaxID=1834097 RepID=UPI0007FBF51E|nr:hypothetical protein [Mycobacterium sp. 852002-51163_SCH5372311]OBF88989.1 hypothetical protein A5791_17280 [Mycobacterium sp. 852002-51163_SCH5372311]